MTTEGRAFQFSQFNLTVADMHVCPLLQSGSGQLDADENWKRKFQPQLLERDDIETKKVIQIACGQGHYFSIDLGD